MIRQRRDTNQGDSLISVAVLGQGTTPGRAEALAAKIVASLNATDGIADPAAFRNAAEALAAAQQQSREFEELWRERSAAYASLNSNYRIATEAMNNIAMERDAARADRDLLTAERDRLQGLIDAAAKHWLELARTDPIPWEGGLDAAMKAGCDQIRKLAAEVERLRGVSRMCASVLHNELNCTVSDLPRDKWCEQCREVKQKLAEPVDDDREVERLRESNRKLREAVEAAKLDGIREERGRWREWVEKMKRQWGDMFRREAWWSTAEEIERVRSPQPESVIAALREAAAIRERATEQAKESK